MKSLTKLTVAVVTAVIALPAIAQETRPASFDHPEDKRRLLNLLEWPEVSGKIEVVLSCFSQVQDNGKMKSTGCYLRNNYDEPFARAVNEAAKKARLVPAVVDGKEQDVFLQFQVKFVKTEESQDIYFILNPGYEENVKAYGFGHIAGQRVIGKKEPWSAACPQRARYAVWVRAYLSEEGYADNATIDHVEGIVPTATCQDAIKQTILTSRYTPAYSDGQPVPSTFIEAFSN
jgi:hypothetical protein